MHKTLPATDDRATPPGNWVTCGKFPGPGSALVLVRFADGDPEVLSVGELARTFGRRDPAQRALAGFWYRVVDDEHYPIHDEALGDLGLLNTVTGARVPIAEVPRLLGCAVDTDGVSAIMGRPARTAATIAMQPNTRAKAVRATVLALDAGADWIDQYASPLGKRKHLDLCRKGVFATAKKPEGTKQWFVRRAEIDAFIEGNRKPAKPTATDEIDRELAALGLGDGGSR